jgi:hypothetical protein
MLRHGIQRVCHRDRGFADAHRNLLWVDQRL